MKYTITLNGAAKHDIEGLTAEVQAKIIHVLREMEQNPFCGDHKKFQGSEAHRIRVGSHRIIHGVNQKSKTIQVVGIKDRRDAY